MAFVNNWVSLFSALLTPTIAVIGIYIGIQNYRLAVRRRKDELFDRRYTFLKSFEKFWKTTGSEANGFSRPELDWDDIEPWAQEAFFLFGPEIAEHLRSYEGKSYNNPMTWIPDAELYKPFNKYLCFE